MSLSNLIRTVADTCRYCDDKVGVLARDHPECRRTLDAAKTHQFNEDSLRVAMAEIARDSYGNGATINQCWKRVGSRH